jgi:hypothetical protein
MYFLGLLASVANEQKCQPCHNEKNQADSYDCFRFHVFSFLLFWVQKYTGGDF